jgi:hypothetical protein
MVYKRLPHCKMLQNVFFVRRRALQFTLRRIAESGKIQRCNHVEPGLGFAASELGAENAECMRTFSWVGISGITYAFEVYPSNLDFRHVAGVYILCGESPEGQPEAFYVGETRSFHDILNGNEVHLGFSHVALLPCADPFERHRIQNDLRQVFDEAAKWQ